MKYERIKNLSSKKIRTLTGIKPETFKTMLRILNEAENKKSSYEPSFYLILDSIV